MSEPKGRAVAKGAAHGCRVYMALLLLQAFLRAVFGITVPVLMAVTDVLIAMSLATFAVAVAWNVGAWFEEEHEKRRAARETDRVCDLLAKYPPPVRTESTVGSLRYMGPPPIAYVTEVTYEVREGVRVFTGARTAEERVPFRECRTCPGCPIQ